MGQMAIGEVARLAGIRTSAIRYYERVGLLPAPQRINGRRRYDSNVLKKIALIHFAQQAGLTVGEIRTLFYEFPTDIPPSVRWQNVSSRKLEEVEMLLRKVTMMKTLLESTLQCNCPTLDDCGIVTTAHINDAQGCLAERQ
jgi:MerR family transcriptional regulator, redox-sensitive transcriptional activator SoxR